VFACLLVYVCHLNVPRCTIHYSGEMIAASGFISWSTWGHDAVDVPLYTFGEFVETWLQSNVCVCVCVRVWQSYSSLKVD
jgi:hypothetical protein